MTKIKDIIKKKGGHPSPKNRIKDQLDCLCDCTPSAINPDISLKDFVEGTLEEFVSDYVETVDGTTTSEIDWDKLNGREAAAAE